MIIVDLGITGVRKKQNYHLGLFSKHGMDKETRRLDKG